MRESDARSMLCPFTFNNPNLDDNGYCKATSCMAWHKAKDGLGYCKLIDQRYRR